MNVIKDMQRRVEFRLHAYVQRRTNRRRNEKDCEKVRENERKVVYTGEIDRNISNELQRETE